MGPDIASNIPARQLLFQACSWARVFIEAQVPGSASYLVPNDDANQSGVSAPSITGKQDRERLDFAFNMREAGGDKLDFRFPSSLDSQVLELPFSQRFTPSTRACRIPAVTDLRHLFRFSQLSGPRDLHHID